MWPRRFYYKASDWGQGLLFIRRIRLWWMSEDSAKPQCQKNRESNARRWVGKKWYL